MSEEEFKSSPIYLVPIFGSLLVSIACASLVLVSEVSVDPVLILPESGYGPLLNGVIFVIAAGSGATLIYLLLKHGVYRFVRALMGFAISVLTFSLVVFYSELVVVVLESIAQVELGVPVAGVIILATLATVFCDCSSGLDERQVLRSDRACFWWGHWSIIGSLYSSVECSIHLGTISCLRCGCCFSRSRWEDSCQRPRTSSWGKFRFQRYPHRAWGHNLLFNAG